MAQRARGFPRRKRAQHLCLPGALLANSYNVVQPNIPPLGFEECPTSLVFHLLRKAPPPRTDEAQIRDFFDFRERSPIDPFQ